MADINVKDLSIRGGADQLVGNEVRATVVVNNREAFGGGAGACSIDAPTSYPSSGHKARVTFQVLRGSEVVYERERELCAPTEPVASANDGDPHLEFEFTPDSEGRYVVRATTEGIPNGASHTVEEAVNVDGSLPAEDADDGGPANGGGTPDNDNDLFGGDGNDSGSPFGGSSLPNPDILLAVVALLAIAWLANSASNTAEAVT